MRMPPLADYWMRSGIHQSQKLARDHLLEVHISTTIGIQEGAEDQLGAFCTFE